MTNSHNRTPQPFEPLTDTPIHPNPHPHKPTHTHPDVKQNMHCRSEHFRIKINTLNRVDASNSSITNVWLAVSLWAQYNSPSLKFIPRPVRFLVKEKSYPPHIWIKSSINYSRWISAAGYIWRPKHLKYSPVAGGDLAWDTSVCACSLRQQRK